jgi:hypothetical protein
VVHRKERTSSAVLHHRAGISRASAYRALRGAPRLHHFRDELGDFESSENGSSETSRDQRDKKSCRHCIRHSHTPHKNGSRRRCRCHRIASFSRYQGGLLAAREDRQNMRYRGTQAFRPGSLFISLTREELCDAVKQTETRRGQSSYRLPPGPNFWKKCPEKATRSVAE